MDNNIVIGIEALKDEFRKAKLKVGDMRGIGKNKFELCTKFGIPELQAVFYSLSNQSTEVNANIYYGEDGSTNAYNMKMLIDEVNDIEENEMEISLICLKWNKYHNDAARNTIISFTFKKQLNG